MRDFVAIDFETANAQPCSICAVGVVVVRNHIITNSAYQLIRPVPNYYHYINIGVHGITAADTADAPQFPEVWEQIDLLIDGLPLVAHNKRFDERCLKAAFRYFELTYPDYEFLCTLVASRRVFGKSLPNHRLPTVAAACGYSLNHHHNALADAQACAAIAMTIL